MTNPSSPCCSHFLTWSSAFCHKKVSICLAFHFLWRIKVPSRLVPPPLLLLPTHPDSFPIRRARAHGCCPGTPRSPRSSARACAAACYLLSYEALAPTGAENAASGLHTAPRASSARIPWASVSALLVPRTELWHTGLT